MTRVAPRIVNSVSCVKRIDPESYFSWQAQYLVSLDNDTCYSAHCINSVSCVKRIDHESHFAWQAQYLLKLEADCCCSAHCK